MWNLSRWGMTSVAPSKAGRKSKTSSVNGILLRMSYAFWIAQWNTHGQWTLKVILPIKWPSFYSCGKRSPGNLRNVCPSQTVAGIRLQDRSLGLYSNVSECDHFSSDLSVCTSHLGFLLNAASNSLGLVWGLRSLFLASRDKEVSMLLAIRSHWEARHQNTPSNY